MREDPHKGGRMQYFEEGLNIYVQYFSGLKKP
jgi:hypothetical protein